MMRKREGKVQSSIPMGVAVGAGGSMVITMLLTALAANLVSREAVTEAAIDGLSAGVLLLSAVGGSLMAVAVTGHHRLQICMATGLIYFLMLLACTAMLFDGMYRGVGVTAVLILGGCGGVALLGLKDGKKTRRSAAAKKRYWKVVQN